MLKETILVIDDEADIRELLTYNLKRQGFRVIGAGSGEEGLDSMEKNAPDLVLLDVMLPGLSGLEVCKRLKQNKKTRTIPVIMLTARGADEDVIDGLDSGADDYVTKPFSPKILIARIRAALRRKAEEKQGSQKIQIHDLIIDPKKHEIFVNDNRVALTLTQFRILSFLAHHAGWVFSRTQIVTQVKGEDVSVVERSVDVQIAGLRKKLGSAGAYIETVRGIGYRFRA